MRRMGFRDTVKNSAPLGQGVTFHQSRFSGKVSGVRTRLLERRAEDTINNMRSMGKLRRIVAGIIALVALMVFTGGCNRHTAPPSTGQLEIQVSGLPPEGAKDLQIWVQGPGGYYAKLKSQTFMLLSDLQPGVYKVQFTGVPIGETLYLPQAFSLLAQVEGGKKTTVVMTYTPQATGFKYELAPNAKILEEEDVLEVSEDSLKLRAGLQIEVGDVLVFPGSPRIAPDGFIRKVFSVDVRGDFIEVKTEASPLTEAYKELYVEIHKEITPYEIAAELSTYDGEGFDLTAVMKAFGSYAPMSSKNYSSLPIVLPGRPFKASPQGEGYEVTVENCQDKGFLKVCIGIDIQGPLPEFAMDIKLDIFNFEFKRLKLVFTGTLGGYIDLDLIYPPSNDEDEEKSKMEILTLPLGKWPVGPVVLSPELYGSINLFALSAELDPTSPGNLEVSLAKAKVGVPFRAGLDYSDGQINPIIDFDFEDTQLEVALFDGDVSKPLEGEIGAGAEAGVGLRAKLYELVGPFAEFLTGPVIEADLTCSQDPWWDLNWQSDANVGLELDLLGLWEAEASLSLNLGKSDISSAEPILSVDPTQLQVNAGGSAEFSVIPHTLNPFCASDTFHFSLSEGGSTPTDLYVEPDQAQPQEEGTPIPLNLVATPDAVAAQRALSLIVDTGRTKRTFPLTLSVLGGPSFTLSLAPDQLSATQGESVQTTLTVTPQNGFSGDVSLSLSLQDGNPAPSGFSLSPTSVSVAGETVSETLTIHVDTSVAPGSYDLRLVGSANGKTAHADFTFTVNKASNEDEGSGDTTWTLQNSGTSERLHAVTYGDGIFVTVGYGGIILTSTDGTAWTQQDSGIGESLNGVAYGNNTFVAVGDGGIILASSSGTDWKFQSSGTTASLRSVTYGNGTFVTVGYNGIILTSPNGINWISQNSGTSASLIDVTYGDGTFVAVGGGGTILTSSDGITWTSQNSGTTNWLNSATYGNGTFVTVGLEGTILASPDGTDWEFQNSGIDAPLGGVTFGNDTFVAVGWYGIILTSP